jgi:hypothetical protein
LIFPLDVGIKHYFAGITELSEGTGPVDSSVILSSNSWAFRGRIKQKGSLVFPFVNYRILPGGVIRPETTAPKNYATAIQGFMFDDVGTKVQSQAFTARYEATFWSTNFASTMYVFEKVYSEVYRDILIDYSYVINGKTFTFQAPLAFSNLSLDPQWEEQSEIDKGNIHSIDLSFEINAFLFKGMRNLGSNTATYSVSNPCIVTSLNHGLNNTDLVTVGGSTNGDIDGTWRISIIDKDHFALLDCNNNKTGSVAGNCQWYSGFKPISQLELDLFYSNGVIDGNTPDRTLIFP